MKIICVGRNYTEHITELKNEKPEHPVLFCKPDTAIILKNQPFFVPDFSNNVHYEVEILVKIKKVGKHIQEKFASKYYDEIGLGVDFTARDLQQKLKEKGLPWEKAKSFDGSALIGRKWIHRNDLESVDNIGFSLQKNDKIVQSSNSSYMLWKIDALIAYISKYFTLKIGDIIFTGTPNGIGKLAPEDNLKGFIGKQEIFNINIK